MKTRQELILEFMVAMSPKVFDFSEDGDEITVVLIRECAELFADEYLEYTK
jgi:hypothetical protein